MHQLTTPRQAARGTRNQCERTIAVLDKFTFTPGFSTLMMTPIESLRLEVLHARRFGKEEKLSIIPQKQR